MKGCACVDGPPAGYSIPAPPTLYCSSDSFKVEAERSGNEHVRKHTRVQVLFFRLLFGSLCLLEERIPFFRLFMWCRNHSLHWVFYCENKTKQYVARLNLPWAAELKEAFLGSSHPSSSSKLAWAKSFNCCCWFEGDPRERTLLSHLHLGFPVLWTNSDRQYQRKTQAQTCSVSQLWIFLFVSCLTSDLHMFSIKLPPPVHVDVLWFLRWRRSCHSASSSVWLSQQESNSTKLRPFLYFFTACKN